MKGMKCINTYTHSINVMVSNESLEKDRIKAKASKKSAKCPHRQTKSANGEEN